MDSGFKKIILRNAVSFGLLISLVLLLGFNFQKILTKQQFEKRIRTELIKRLSDISSTFLTDLRFNPDGNKIIIIAVVRTPRTITPHHVGMLESRLQQLTAKSVELLVRSVSIRVINKNGDLDDERGQLNEEKL